MYHNILITLLITLIYCAPLSAQYFELSDQTVFGGDADDTPADIIESGDGGYYILNTSVSGINGNKTVQNYGSSDYWLIKTDSLFNDEWQLSYGGESLDEAITMLHDVSGNIYLCGHAMGAASGNRTVDAYGQVSYWVIKLDVYGNEIWQKTYGGDVVEYLYDAVMFDNKLYMIGSSSSGVSGVKTGFNRGGADYWLVCTDTAGNMLWDKTYGGNETDRPKTLVADSIDGDLYIAGYSGSDASHEKSEDNIGSDDLWLLKVDATDGTLITEKTIGSNGFDDFYSGCLALNDNNLYILSTSNGDISGYKTDSCRGSFDYWLIKTDLDFNPVWDKTLGGTKGEVAKSIITKDDLVILGGSSSSDSGFEKTEDAYVSGMSDAWFVGLDISGNIQWNKVIGSYENDGYVNIYKENSALLIAMAIYNATQSGDLNVTPFGDYDNWIFRMSVPWSNAAGNQKILDADLYPNPASEKVTIKLPENNDATVRVYSASGRLLLSEQINTRPYTLDIASLKSGMYIVEIIQENKVRRNKLIVR